MKSRLFFAAYLVMLSSSSFLLADQSDILLEGLITYALEPKAALEKEIIEPAFSMDTPVVTSDALSSLVLAEVGTEDSSLAISASTVVETPATIDTNVLSPLILPEVGTENSSLSTSANPLGIWQKISSYPFLYPKTALLTSAAVLTSLYYRKALVKKSKAAYKKNPRLVGHMVAVTGFFAMIGLAEICGLNQGPVYESGRYTKKCTYL